MRGVLWTQALPQPACRNPQSALWWGRRTLWLKRWVRPGLHEIPLRSGTARRVERQAPREALPLCLGPLLLTPRLPQVKSLQTAIQDEQKALEAGDADDFDAEEQLSTATSVLRGMGPGGDLCASPPFLYLHTPPPHLTPPPFPHTHRHTLSRSPATPSTRGI